MKPGQIAFASFVMKVDTDNPEVTAAEISELFSREKVVVPKRTKNGFIDLDLKPYLDRTEVISRSGGVEINTILPAGSTMIDQRYIIGKVKFIIMPFEKLGKL